MSVSAPAEPRARRPDADGFVERDGVRVFYEVYGSGGPTVLLPPTWSIVNSRVSKLQIGYLARRFRVITFDGRGSARSDRPIGVDPYTIDEFAADAVAVLDATATQRTTLVALSAPALWTTVVAADAPERVDRVVYIAPANDLAPGHPERAAHDFEADYETHTGWAKYNAGYWRGDYRGFLEFFFGEAFSEPHSEKQIEDAVRWPLDVDAGTLAQTDRAVARRREPFAATSARVRCPTLVIHGDLDRIRPLAQGRALAAATGGRLVTLRGCGRLPNLREPVRVNLLLRDVVEHRAP
jgi:pimeloyl-ACP methyl ester carboxylesterase